MTKKSLSILPCLAFGIACVTGYMMIQEKQESLQLQKNLHPVDEARK